MLQKFNYNAALSLGGNFKNFCILEGHEGEDAIQLATAWALFLGRLSDLTVLKDLLAQQTTCQGVVVEDIEVDEEGIPTPAPSGDEYNAPDVSDELAQGLWLGGMLLIE